ncbi:MAG: type II toxin-antitoxin system ParD family antitoxin [Chitinophagales bacterium]
MSTIRKSISFTNKLNNWIQEIVAEGEYTNESEYIRDLVRKDRERKAKYQSLKAAIDKGLNSGVSSKSIPDIIKDVENKLGKNGHL